MGKQTKLEQIGLEQRAKTISRNDFNTTADNKMYSRSHTKALSDDETPNQGKGTGKQLDTQGGGSKIDINGDPAIISSGRVGNTRLNAYNNKNEYTKPDTSGNIGQVGF